MTCDPTVSYLESNWSKIGMNWSIPQSLPQWALCATRQVFISLLHAELFHCHPAIVALVWWPRKWKMKKQSILMDFSWLVVTKWFEVVEQYSKGWKHLHAHFTDHCHGKRTRDKLASSSSWDFKTCSPFRTFLFLNSTSMLTVKHKISPLASFLQDTTTKRERLFWRYRVIFFCKQDTVQSFSSKEIYSAEELPNQHPIRWRRKVGIPTIFYFRIALLIASSPRRDSNVLWSFLHSVALGLASPAALHTAWLRCYDPGCRSRNRVFVKAGQVCGTANEDRHWIRCSATEYSRGSTSLRRTGL